MQGLYRKYRPRTFSEVVGQNHIKVTLSNEISQSQMAHAYLFVGPRGTGKTTIARLTARALNCEKRKKQSAEPCNACGNCERMLKDQSLDIIEIDAATHTDVENVRENIVANAHVPPYYAQGYKVFIIDEVHMLSKHAFNALLKTIEEPPSRVIFILATTDVYKVPETVISRCQRFDFRRIPQKLIMDRLTHICAQENVRVSEQTIRDVARQSGGYLRDAESLLGQVLSLAEDGEVSEELAGIIIQPTNWQHLSELLTLLKQRNSTGALACVQDVMNQGADADTVLGELVEFLRQMLLKKTIGPSYAPDFDDATAQSISELAGQFSLDEIRQLLDIFTSASARLRSSLIPELPLELGCIEFCHTPSAERANEPPPAESKRSAGDAASTSTAPDGRELNLLMSRWSAVLEEVRAHNHSLAVFLKSAHPLDIATAAVTLGFKFDFHASKVMEEKNKKAVESALGSILNRRVTIDCKVDPNYTENHKKFNGDQDPDVQQIIDAMGGGEVV